MKAIICTRYGPPEVLRLAEVPKPIPRAGELLVRVHASTVSAADFRCRSFTIPPAFWLPARLALGVLKPRRPILGAEFSGEIEETGPGVTKFERGDQIYASVVGRFGGYAEYACLSEAGAVAIKPSNLSYAEAAAVPIGARTALHFLQKANLESGQKVLVYGASGSVGTFAVQLAKYYGADVTAVCSGKNLELVKSLGADIAIDYARENFASQGKIYDVIFVAVDKVSFSDCMKALKPSGTYLNVTAPVRSLRMWRVALFSDKTIITGQSPAENGDDLVFLRGLLEEGRLRPVIDRRYPLEQIVEAHRYVDQGHKRGNVVIAVTLEA